ncbi:T9SS type A sorting domain-containing protein [Flavobacterium sp. MK4S-17]|uniref:T9SS type A sorting domain-containing protein n=1 Tax=Flavobacterium sp. MK4S-17 TaxID=2543737 RepID=UPI0013574020|nr:T9SS type A sorting domain-containing protein [Flavobacterium sp. MK4S-17]
MSKKLLFILFLFVAPFAASAQYTTPGTGVNWSLNDLVANAPSAITFADGIYTINQDITIAATDALVIEEDAAIQIASDVLITVAGSFTADSDNITITAVNNNEPYEGFRFEDTSSGYFHNTTITYGGGIRVLTPNFEMDACTVSYHVSGAATGSAVSFSTGSPVVKNSTFLFNDLPAFSSGANQEVSALILNNYLEGNGQSNQNRPQINMGPSGNDTLRIVGNTIKGDPALTMVGGIAASSLLGTINKVIIDNNTVFDNRYGITVVGGASSGYIRGNIIENNNTQNVPAQGGSGISLSASGAGMNIIASDNQIRGNLWGITVISAASINLGNTDPANYNPGGNVFSNNGNGGQIYALYNNTPYTIYAMNNCWIEGEEPTGVEVENVISHSADNASLGEVIYTPFGCNLSSPEYTVRNNEIYPNPTNGNFTVNSIGNGNAKIYNISGQMVYEHELTEGENTFRLSLPSGIYIVKTESGGKSLTDKLIIK